MTQIAYNGHPLYYYSGDKNPGDATGQGVGGNWFVVSPSGTPIQSGGSTNPSTGGAPASGAPAASPTPY